MNNKPQMVPGFNHNIKHKGQIYHIQTEDSGTANPHIITHLFVGGNILATKKTSYADIVQADNLHEIVRELMQEQHKAMLRNLINGVYDDIASSPANAAAAAAPAPAAPAQEPAAAPRAPASQPPQPAQAPASQPPRPAQAPASQPPRPAQSPAGQPPRPAQAPASQPRPAQAPVSQPRPAQAPVSQPPRPAQAPPGRPPAAPASLPPRPTSPPGRPAAGQPPVTLIPKARPPAPLEPGKFPIPAAASASRPPAPVRPSQPPAREASANSASTGFSRPITGTQIHRPPAPERVPVAKKPTTKVTLRPKQLESAGGPAAEANLPPEVLAARRLADKPKPKDTSGPTIFGENLISEKSLDEVILGYLAGNEDGSG